MTYLSFLVQFLARFISKRRTTRLVLIPILALIFAQPILISAKPAARERSQLAELAQITPTGRAENEEDGEEDEQTPTVTTEPTETAPPADQSNLVEPTGTVTDVLNIEIPSGGGASGEGSYALPFGWQGASTISAQELVTVAPPLQADVVEGDFQISFVEAETGDVIRILPVPTEGTLGNVRVGIMLDPTSSVLPFPAGQALVIELSARVYAPDATTRLLIADDNGSSSVPLDGLNWTNYQVTRQIAADATSLEVMLEWRNVPANGWLEMRGLNVTLLPTVVDAALSPTDTPSIIEEVTIESTAPPPPTPTPTAATIATATPIPDTVVEITPTAAAAEVPPVEEATAQPAATEAPPTEVPTVEATAIITDLLPTPTPTYIVVTSTPTPVDVYEQATRIAQATEWAAILGTETPTPANLATPTPTITPIVVTETPVPQNEATVAQMSVLATAIAFTTGTPTPLPPDAIVMIATYTPIPPIPPTATPRATQTPTPIFVLVDEIPVAQPSATPNVPAILEGKIVFLSSFRGNPRAPNAMVMNPDGTGVGLLTTNFFHSIAAGQDTYSSDGRYRVYPLREAGGAAHNAGLIQLFYDDAYYSSTQHQLTYFGAGVAWSPAWSPTSETIAYVSSESGNDEIWVSQRAQWPASQLTKNDWEWDHHPSFSPDGSQIVFASNRVTGRRQLWLMTSSGGDQRQLTNFTFEAWDPVWVKYVEGENDGTSDATTEGTTEGTTNITTDSTTVGK